MRFVADECVDAPIVAALRAKGHLVTYITETAPSSEDSAVLEAASTSGSVLITEDKGFGDMVFNQGAVHSGVVLVRLAGLPPGEKARLVCALVDSHGVDLVGNFAVLSRHNVRIRHRRHWP